MNFRITLEKGHSFVTNTCYIITVANTYQYFIHNTWRVKCPPLPRFISDVNRLTIYKILISPKKIEKTSSSPTMFFLFAFQLKISGKHYAGNNSWYGCYETSCQRISALFHPCSYKIKWHGIKDGFCTWKNQRADFS